MGVRKPRVGYARNRDRRHQRKKMKGIYTMDTHAGQALT